MTEKPCIYVSRGCAFKIDAACTEEEKIKCSEADRRAKLASEPCPVMTARGFSGSSAECDDSDLRAQVPAGKPCHINGKCIRELSTAIQSLQGQKKRYPELRRPIRETLATFQA